MSGQCVFVYVVFTYINDSITGHGVSREHEPPTRLMRQTAGERVLTVTNITRLKLHNHDRAINHNMLMHSLFIKNRQ